MSATDKAVEMLKEELADLDRERKRIEDAILALTDKGAQRVSRAARGRRRRTAAKPRKKGGKTQTQRFLDDVARHPGTTVAEAAKRLNLPAPNLYATAGNLTKTNRVRKSGAKYFPKAAPKKKPAAKKKAAAKKA